MGENLRGQIQNSMSLKETDELLSIWKTNNRAEWSDDAFDAIKDILTSRGEDIPTQNEPVYEIEDIEQVGEENEEDDGLSDEYMEDWERKLIDEEDQPELYSVTDVISLNRNINIIIKAAVLIYALLGFVSIRSFFTTIPISISSILQYGFDIFSIVLTVGVRAVLVYFPLKALTHILRILMEMEFRSRKAD